ncbi:MAG: hypothetical protein SH847_15370 [Roseiflexaceae bacterium]|nr:hypothetical protein [Roseiflexaceae bacterium]
MTIQEVTLHVPERVYDQIRRAAERAHRSIDDILLEALIAVAPTMMESPAVRSSFAQLTFLNDAALWQAARATMQPEQRERLEDLHDKQQREGLSTEEFDEEQALVGFYREMVLLRGQATVLLKRRGYDVRDANQFEPLV